MILDKSSPAAADIYTLDKAAVRASFSRAATRYDAAAIVQTLVRNEMLSRLDLVKLRPAFILDVGCGTGLGSVALQKKFKNSQVLSLDFALGMVQHTRQQQPRLQKWLKPATVLCADMDALPLASGNIHLLWSNLAIQWSNDLDATFAEMHRVMAPESLLVFSTFGPDTLRELRAATHAENTSSVSRFIDMHDIGDALVRAGFNAPVLDVERYTLTYSDVKSVMRDLKSIGANNATAGRTRGLKGKTFLQNLTQNYEKFRKNGKLPATFEVVFGHAWKPQAAAAVQEGYAPVTFRKRL